MDEKLNLIAKDFDKNMINSLTPYLQFIISVISFSLSGIINKSLIHVVREYNEFSFIFIRFFMLALINYSLMNEKDKESIEIKNEDRFWVYVRNFSTFLGFMFLSLSLNYLRLGTAICILNMYPVWTSILSIIILKEKFYVSYVIGGIICFSGSVIISLNERNNKLTERIIPYSLILLGVLYSFLNSLAAAIQQIASKILSDRYDTFYLNYLLGIYGAISALVFGLLSGNFFYFLFNPTVIYHGIMNAVVSFFAFHYRNISYKRIEVIKVQMLVYLQIVFSVIAGVFFFDEIIYVTDFMGASMIVGYNVYSVFMASKAKK